jgi:tRNA modification GTPase
MMYDDTISAIATPPGEGGIGIVRLSGPAALPITQQLFRPFKTGPLRSHHVRYGHIVEPNSGKVVDEVLFTLMRAPHSFTREDVVELSCHGGALPLQRILELTLAGGARLAQPGEFTMRAFLNGRIDLTQAEATLDIIRAQTSAGLSLAQAQLGGWLAADIRRIRADLLEALAAVTVTLDFPEDEVEPHDITPTLRARLHDVEHLLTTADQGIVYRQGARAALVGRPNAGKSSLLNVLLRADRAIVTPVPGTTRDTLEETANLAGIPVVLIDTAGITESADPVERLGVERSRAALAGADLALLVLDSSQPPTAADEQIAALTLEKPTLLVWSKADQHPGYSNGSNSLDSAALPELPIEHHQIVGSVLTSAATGQGIEELAQEVARVLLGSAAPASGAQLVTNPRHRDALHRAAERLHGVIEGWNSSLPPDLLAGDLTVALNALGEITGDVVGEDLLDTIFSRFCIGK